jgi:hypothetical protein
MAEQFAHSGIGGSSNKKGRISDLDINGHSSMAE